MTRVGYRSGERGVPALFPRDAVLSLPPQAYSWRMQRLAVMFARAGSYEQAREFVLAATGVGIGKRQLGADHRACRLLTPRSSARPGAGAGQETDPADAAGDLG